MNIKSRIAKFTGQRKIVEVPSKYRNLFEIGEEVVIKKKVIKM